MLNTFESLKKIRVVYILRIILVTLGILATLIFWCYKHIQIEIVNSESSRFFFYFTFAFGIIYVLYTIITKNEDKITKIVGFIVLLALILYNISYIDINLRSITNTYFYAVLISLQFFVYIYIHISYKRKLLILETERLIFSCENGNNLCDLINNYDSALKKAKRAKRLLSFGRDKRVLNSYLHTLVNCEQYYIRNTVLKNYKDIVDNIETKKIHFSRSIYVNCKKIISSINLYINRLDKSNTDLCSLILEKSYLIMNFTEKYIDTYNVNTQYNIDFMKGQDFENYCANLLIAYGFKNIEVTKGSGDQGVDIIGYYNGYKYAIQCKRYSKKLGNSPVQEVVAGKNFYNCQNAMVITNNYFTNAAIQLAKANNVELWDRNNLMQVIYYTDSQWDELLEKIKIEE